MDTRNKISAGSYDLNKWLYGGYEKDIITTICGNSGTGKTNFSLLVCMSIAKKNGKVVFIDTEGGFSVERIRQMLSDEDKENYEKIMENILLFKPTNFLEQEEAFRALLKEIKNENNKVSLIVIDGMTMLYRLELAEARKERNEEERYSKIDEINSKLAKQMRILSEIARKKNIPVIVTNQVYSEFLSKEEMEAGKTKETFMVGGDILKYWSKCIIELKNERGKRKAILKKHRSLRESEFDFEIDNLGIRKKGWL